MQTLVPLYRFPLKSTMICSIVKSVEIPLRHRELPIYANLNPSFLKNPQLPFENLLAWLHGTLHEEAHVSHAFITCSLGKIGKQVKIFVYSMFVFCY